MRGRKVFVKTTIISTFFQRLVSKRMIQIDTIIKLPKVDGLKSFPMVAYPKRNCRALVLLAQSLFGS